MNVTPSNRSNNHLNGLFQAVQALARQPGSGMATLFKRIVVEAIEVGDRRRSERPLSHAATARGERSPYEGLACGVITLNKEGVVVDANTRAEHILNVSLARMRGRALVSMLAPMSREDGSNVVEGDRPLRQALISGRSQHDIVLRVTRPDGQIRWLQFDIAPESVAEVALPLRGCVCSFIDITARKQAEDGLQASEEHLRLLLEKTRDLIGLHDIDGRYVYLSPCCRDILGFDPDELIGVDPYTLVHPDDHAHIHSEGYDWVRQGFPTQPIMYRIRHKSGVYIWLEVLTQPVFDERESVVSWITSSRDVSERQIAHEALRASEQRFRATFEQAAVGIAHIGLDGRCLLVNQRLCDITGRARDFILGRRYQTCDESGSFAVLTTSKRLLDIDQVNGRRLLQGELQTYTREKRYIRSDRTEVWLDATVSLARAADGAPAYFVWILQDVTQRKQAEDALRDILDVERRRIARDMHDNVLQDLTSATQSLQVTQRRVYDTELSDDLRQEIGVLQRAASGLRDAVYNLYFDTVKDRTFIDTIEYLVGLSRRLEPRQEIHLVIGDGFPPDLPAKVGIELARIIRGALVNAQRHADATQIVVTVGSDEQELWFIVADDGRGIDTTTILEGVGIASMRERAHLIGGTFNITSAIGVGTRVELRAPRALLGRGDVVYEDADRRLYY